jgi:hypothetical protein
MLSTADFIADAVASKGINVVELPYVKVKLPPRVLPGVVVDTVALDAASALVTESSVVSTAKSFSTPAFWSLVKVTLHVYSFLP